jgi:hypothetical protein
MTEKEKKKIIARVKRAESLIMKGESELSCLAEVIQPLFDQEVFVTWSTDGAMVIDDSGELGPFVEYLDDIPLTPNH